MPESSKNISLIITLVLVIGLNACGFKLRGSGALRPEMRQVYITEEYLESNFGRKLNQALQARGAAVVTNKEQATGILELTEPDKNRRLLSVNTLAQARDYLLALTVKLTLKDAQGKAVLSNQKVEVRRELVADPSNVLGSDQEAQRLFAEMEKELVQAILMRLLQ